MTYTCIIQGESGVPDDGYRAVIEITAYIPMPGNENAVRNVVIDNCVITDSNRGIAFMTFDGGDVENVVISNCTIDCRRFDWFWWGDGDPIYFMARRRSPGNGTAPTP